MTYEVLVDRHAARIAIEGGQLRYESGSVVESAYDICVLNCGRYSVTINGRSYTAMVMPGGQVAVNGRVYEVEVIDPRAFRARGAAGQTGGRQTITALMPGRVIHVLVEAGQRVKAGQGLIVVEAMKMQNEMKAPGDCKIADIRVIAGDTVVAGQLLVIIE